ncbi:MAG: class I SAM-dependent methyltransferase [Candidatus Viridilinea halotolerans]|uniref:Class I SAM-dependent methyltransferase n=1 Tax=Candidatus Viridilinea halotolerans TaxID=2491704 RepID=A0A426U3S4_9CHLR|nr:MAG: class I SAM-dependent methyltransferase [Candidatus Viridilinea halotolerans]
MLNLTDNLLDRVSAAPRLWNGLRWLVEAGYGGERLAIARELRPWAGDQRRFLDLGCGTGEFAPDFPPERYVGVDPAAGYVRFAGQHRPGSYLVSLGQQLPLRDASFDAALICGVLHHLDDGLAKSLMRELARVLHPAATVLVMEDIPPPAGTNPAGHLMHQLDRGGYIRTDADYLGLFGGWFQVNHHYHMRSGICDYAVYVLSRLP